MTKEESAKKIELANQILAGIRETLEQIREANEEELED